MNFIGNEEDFKFYGCRLFTLRFICNIHLYGGAMSIGTAFI